MLHHLHCTPASLPIIYHNSSTSLVLLCGQRCRNHESPPSKILQKSNRFAKLLPCIFSSRSCEGFTEQGAARQIALQCWTHILSLREERLRRSNTKKGWGAHMSWHLHFYWKTSGTLCCTLYGKKKSIED